ncbi:Ultraviolet-B receptor uvr8 [Datura stramonium]|uniref:Ultraviolet-B receptor uvr8 n=1 Tax=Datura stramonium TaxID=4076 RepID=A0ABS8T1K3_DATST|nr:Ultraviolet-B receptor uvr8 [Datura stramonium]
MVFTETAEMRAFCSEFTIIGGLYRTKDNLFDESMKNINLVCRMHVHFLIVLAYIWTKSAGGVSISFGRGDFGRLGHGNSSDLFTPQPIKALQGIRIKQIACGDSHCLAVTMEGEVQSWGRNQNGQLGLGTTEDSLVPRKIEAFMGIPVKMVAAGAEHTAAVTEDGELYGWGWGRYGNLGLGDRNDRLVPEKVSANVVGILCGMFLLITIRLFLITATTLYF